MKKIDLPLFRILDDLSFRFSSHDPSKTNRIAESIRQIGMRTPLIAIEREEGFQLLAGFTRLAAAREAGLDSVPAEIPDAGEALGPIFFAVLLEHRSLSEFRLFEKARILNILDALYLDSTLREQILLLLELPDKATVLDAMRQLLTLSLTLQTYLEKYDVALKQAAAFYNFSVPDQAWLADLGEKLLIRPVELIEIATPIEEISKREGKPFQTIVQDLETPNLLASEAPRSQIISEIKRRIAECRYPRWTEIQANIAKSQKALSLPDFVQLRWDRSLEAPGVQLQVSLNKIEDVRALIQALKEGIDTKQFQRLFELVG